MATLEETFQVRPHHSDLGLHHTPLSQTDLDRKKHVISVAGADEKEEATKAKVNLKSPNHHAPSVMRY